MVIRIKDPKVSVIIAKSRDTYKEAVKSLKNQGCEIILARGKDASIARNKAIKKAKGELITFMDDDAIANPSFIKNIKEIYKETNADVIGGLILPKGNVPWWWPNELFNFLAINPIDLTIYGCNMTVKKDLFKKLNYEFDSRYARKKNNLLIGEDLDLLENVKNEGLKIIKSNKPIVYHSTKGKTSFKTFLKKAYWTGASANKAKKDKFFFKSILFNIYLIIIRNLMFFLSLVLFIIGNIHERIKR